MRALITNDDGVHSTGIEVLTQAALDAGLDVVVVAPHEDRSGASASFSSLEDDGRLLFETATVAGTEAFGVHASPAMTVLHGMRGLFGDPPDIVLSGINHGANSGRVVLHSGTVGAGLTAVVQGLPALAVSMRGAEPTHWDTALKTTRTVLTWFLENLGGQPYLLNLNIPDLPAEELRGIRTAPLATFGEFQAEIAERGEGYVKMNVVQISVEAEPESDSNLLRAGWATVTALLPPLEAPSIDLSSIGSSIS